MKLFEQLKIELYYEKKRMFTKIVKDKGFTVTKILTKFIERFIEEPELTLYYLFERKRYEKTNGRRNKGIL